MEFHFEFVTELTTRAQADAVLDAIIKLVEQYGGSVGKDFIAYAEARGADVRTGAHHYVIKTDRGSVAVPYHGAHDLPTGTRHSILKTFIAIGLALLPLACWWLAALHP